MHHDLPRPIAVLLKVGYMTTPDLAVLLKVGY